MQKSCQKQKKETLGLRRVQFLILDERLLTGKHISSVIHDVFLKEGEFMIRVRVYQVTTCSTGDGIFQQVTQGLLKDNSNSII